MTLFSNSNGEIYNYAYNADGIRTQKNVFNANGDFAGSTEYIYDGTKLIAESRNGDWLYYFYDANGTVTGMYYNNVLYYFRKNLQGDITGIYNATGTLVVEYEYTPYGAIFAITDANGVDISNNATHIANINPFRYRGYYYDTETELYYLITRYYDPVVGRFINADSLILGTAGVIEGNNLFVYCFNNPINLTDTTGCWPSWSDIKEKFEEVKDYFVENIVEPVVEVTEEALDWVNNNVVAPVVEFVEETVEFVKDVVEDVRNFDLDNTNEDTVFKSNYFSGYKGALVIKTNLQTSFSYGIIGLSKHQQNSNTLNHEYGHFLQLKDKGWLQFTFDVAIPSVTANLLDKLGKLPYDYYGSPWEMEADLLGGVNRTNNNTPWPEEAYYPFWNLLKLFW